jgi:anthranilate phosphoribosyltransferase
MIKHAISKVVSNKDLTPKEMEGAMKQVTKRNASPAQIASFITALRVKGETPEEITAAAKVIREKASVIRAADDVVCLDREEITVERETILSTTKALTEGTNIFNISTATAFVVSGGGLKVVKYGRKSASPLCGSADVVEALGIDLDMTPTQLERCVEEVGVCFLYEPLIQNELEHIIGVRRKIGIRTIFNLLDPLINPARARIQVLGVYEPDLTETMARVLKNLGIKKGLVFHGEETWDEISIVGKTRVTQFRDDEMRTYVIQPEDFGMKRGRLVDIRGGTREQNAEIIQEILRGGRGARRDIIILNAAAAFVTAGKADSFSQGVEMANQSVDSGEALRKLEGLVACTNRAHRYVRKSYDVEVGVDPRGPFHGS